MRKIKRCEIIYWNCSGAVTPISILRRRPVTYLSNFVGPSHQACHSHLGDWSSICESLSGTSLQFTIDPHHVSPDFPDGYWPTGDAPPDSEAWDRSIAAFRTDLKAMMDLIADPKTDLLTRYLMARDKRSFVRHCWSRTITHTTWGSL